MFYSGDAHANAATILSIEPARRAMRWRDLDMETEQVGGIVDTLETPTE